MPTTDEQLDKKFQEVLASVKKDITDNPESFIDVVSPFTKLIDTLAFYFFEAGFNYGQVMKEIENESEDV
jgi:hypothetical protein